MGEIDDDDDRSRFDVAARVYCMRIHSLCRWEVKLELDALPPSTLHDGPKALPPSAHHERERGGS